MRKIAVLALILGIVLLAVQPTTVQGRDDVTINWVTISGFYTDWAEQVATAYEEQTGVNVNIIDLDIGQMYETQVLESIADTGAFDLLTYDAGQKAEFAESGYLLELDDYIAAANPEEIAFEDIAPALREVTSMWRGKTFGLPYYTFTMGYFYRCDLYENADEMAAFEAEYGYPLGVPQTYEQMADIAAFFRRGPGETLAGQALDDDFYGIGVMAGRFDQVQDDVN